jgi:hypothetical protein
MYELKFSGGTVVVIAVRMRLSESTSMNSLQFPVRMCLIELGTGLIFSARPVSCLGPARLYNMLAKSSGDLRKLPFSHSII